MKTMLLILATMMVFVMVPAFTYAQTTQTSAATPPLSQPLVREGTLAVKMVEALNLGKTTSEAEAENLLLSAGIAPRNGWVADYPVTPDIAIELRTAVSDATTSQVLSMQKDDALNAYDNVISGLNLPVRSDTSGQTVNRESSEGSPDQTVINNYYYNEGPPTVTYYAPPPYYASLYTWVPYPFWWWNFWFPGFFILFDFHRTVFIDGHFAFVSSHFFDVRFHSFVRVDPVARLSVTSAVNRTRVIGPSAVRNVSSFSRNRVVTSRSGTVAPFSGNRWTATSRNSTVASTSGRGSRTLGQTPVMNRNTNRRTFRTPDRSATFNRQMSGSPRAFTTSSTRRTFGSPFGGGRTFSGPSGQAAFNHTFAGHGGAFRGMRMR